MEGCRAGHHTRGCQALVAQAAQHSFQQAGDGWADGVAAHGLHLCVRRGHSRMTKPRPLASMPMAHYLMPAQPP